MTRFAAAALIAWTLSACTSATTPAEPSASTPTPTPAEPTKAVVAAAEPPASPAAQAPAPAEPTKAVVAAAEPPAEPAAPASEAPTNAPEPADAPAGEAAAATPELPAEVAIQPWTTSPHAATWTLRAEPGEPVALALDLQAGVLGRAGSRWFQRGGDGQLAAFELAGEPKPPILGVWPSDAWYVDSRYRKLGEDDNEYLELRLMKLRGGNRWAPQVYSGGGGEQWFHPGTDDEVEPHISTRSGMLVYSPSLESIERVSGKYEAPVIGPHRGRAIDFIESGSGAVYVISQDDAGTYAQAACEDDACVAAKVRRLPLSGWKFGRKVARAKHSVSVLATSDGRTFILHHKGKAEGWLLDELPPGERPDGMWGSQEGGLWTLTGERLRWRDIDGAWRDVALPEGLSAPSVALTEDRKEVWVSGTVAGAPKLFSAPANAQAAAPAATP